MCSIRLFPGVGWDQSTDTSTCCLNLAAVVNCRPSRLSAIVYHWWNHQQTLVTPRGNATGMTFGPVAGWYWHAIGSDDQLRTYLHVAGSVHECFTLPKAALVFDDQFCHKKTQLFLPDFFMVIKRILSLRWLCLCKCLFRSDEKWTRYL